MKHLLVTIYVALLLPAAANAGQGSTGSGSEVLRARCTGCHGDDVVTEQRLERAGWDREVAKMERWSAPIATPERDVLLDYLMRRSRVGSLPTLDPGSAMTGQAVYQRACLSCHDGTLVEQQRLSETAWRRSIAKMVQWGARVQPSDVESLAAYLAYRWPRR